MARILVLSPEKAQPGAVPVGCSSNGDARVYTDSSKFPLRLHKLSLAPGQEVTVGPMETESVGYVWHGAAMAGGHRITAGSSFIVETGEQLTVTHAAEGCDLLLFSASSPGENPAPGGHVHILPDAHVPRFSDQTETGVSGGMHADSDCPTCDVWLHENGFPGAELLTSEQAGVGVHSHSEDEIIFIISGQIRLGRKLFPEGTALAIPADTLYSFTPGPEGMRFINFRAGMPNEVHFANGATMDETGYWRGKLSRPEYLEPA
ncbi:MAG: cupin domain-containing protein [Sphingomonadaceae bacterium]|nr:cupin domain-containing protein [Sphingomonadaceae bacterium]